MLGIQAVQLYMKILEAMGVTYYLQNNTLRLSCENKLLRPIKQS